MTEAWILFLCASAACYWPLYDYPCLSGIPIVSLVSRFDIYITLSDA